MNDKRLIIINGKMLTKFGYYLLSDERRKSFEQNPNFPNNELLEERLSVVNDADIHNWWKLYGKK